MATHIAELEKINELTSQEVIQENRDYTLFSWSVQNASNPIHLKRAEGVYFWDGDDNRWLDFSSQLINMNVGHQHPRCLMPSRNRWMSSALPVLASPQNRGAGSAKSSLRSLA